jgi:hypothetical protein
VNGKKVGSGRVEKRWEAIYSLAGETPDVGIDAWSPVTTDYDPYGNAFAGKINKIVIQLKGDEKNRSQDRRVARSDAGFLGRNPS